MDGVLSYVETYGIAIIVIAICIIAIIGILKLCKVFDKIQSNEIKKVIYYAIDVTLAFVGGAIYFAAFNKDWSGYCLYSIAQLGVTTTLYALYENFGLRKFVKWLIGVIAGWFKKNPDSELSKWANKIGLTESLEIIQGLITEKNTTTEETTIEDTAETTEMIETTEIVDAVDSGNQETATEVVVEENTNTKGTETSSTTRQIQF